MPSFYRAYLKTFDGHVPNETKTITPNRAAALLAFTELVQRSDLDGQNYAAVLSHNNKQVAYHRFDRSQGDSNYWRDRLDEIDFDLF